MARSVSLNDARDHLAKAVYHLNRCAHDLEAAWEDALDAGDAKLAATLDAVYDDVSEAEGVLGRRKRTLQGAARRAR